MKSKIYYFSGTGNSLKIAKDIAERLKDAELISIVKLMRENKIEIKGDCIGFVFPVYFARVPVFIKEFINNTKFSQTSYIFAIANGGGMFGNVLKQFEMLLNKKSKSLDAGFLIKMPGNHPKITSFQKKKPETFFKEEASRVIEITEIVRSQGKHKIEKNFGIFAKFISEYAFRKVYRRSEMKELDKDLWVNDKCINCGNCERICPVDNIIQSNLKVKWLNCCINCSACYNYCPKKAIQLGKDKNDKRYFNPYIPLEEIIANNKN